MEILIKRAKKYDKDAFVTLMQEHEKSMYKVAKAILKNDADVADAMQEAMMTCWEKIKTLKKPEYFKTWLIRILIRKCNDIYRQKKRFLPEMSCSEQLAVEEGFEAVEWKSLLEFLEEKYRTVIILYYVEGFKVREIADILEVSESTVKARMVTAREKIGEIITFEGSVC